MALAVLIVSPNAFFETWNGDSTMNTCSFGLTVDAISQKNLFLIKDFVNHVEGENRINIF